jgi:3-oxoacyl-(acyl-carrier-protein) synthase
MQQTPITIRSAGCISVHGRGPTVLRAALQGQIPCPRRRSPLPEVAAAAGWIDPLPRPERWLGKAAPRLGRMDRLSQLALLAAHQALEAPGVLPPRPERAGVALGTAFGSHLSNELYWHGQRQPEGASPSLFAYTLPSAAAAEISMYFGLKGPLVTVAHGAASGLAALASAASLIAAGAADWMIAGGAEVLSATSLAAEGDAEATPLSEGAAFFVLGRQGSHVAVLLDLDEATQPAGAATEEQGATLGRCFAAAPLLRLATLLEDPAALPCVISARDATSTVTLRVGQG